MAFGSRLGACCEIIPDVIEDAFTRGELAAEAGHALMVAHVRLCEVLIKAVGIVEVIGFVISPKRFIEGVHDLIEGGRLPGAEVHDGRCFGLMRHERGGDDIFNVNMIAFLFAPLEDAGPVAFHHLERELIDHA